MSTSARTLLVTGASGHLGHRVVEILLEKHAGDRVIAASRHTDKLADLAAKGAELRRADFDDAASLATAFAGVDRLLIVSTDALDRPGRRLEQHRVAIAAAKTAGVKHLLYTSLTNPHEGSPITFAKDHRESEQAIAATGIAHTILRNNMYADMLLGSLPNAVKTGELVSASGDGAMSYVSREDCARTAAAALASTATSSHTYEVTGPAALTRAQVAALAAEVSGRPVKHVNIPAAALQAGIVSMGLPAPIAEVIVSFDLAEASGDMAVVAPTVFELTGQQPESLLHFLTTHRAALTG